MIIIIIHQVEVNHEQAMDHGHPDAEFELKGIPRGVEAERMEEKKEDTKTQKEENDSDDSDDSEDEEDLSKHTANRSFIPFSLLSKSCIRLDQ